MSSKYDYYGNILDNNPNVRKFLDVISIMEGTSTFSNPYLARGGTRGELLRTGYENHPMAYGQGKWTFKTNDGKPTLSTANGKYAFIYPTWKGLQKDLGPKLKFDPRSQDIAALHLIAQQGQLDNLVKGNLQPVIQNVGKVWASLPTAPDSYNQFRHGWGKMGQALKTVGLDPTAAGLNGNFKPVKGYNPNPNTAIVPTNSTATSGYGQNVGDMSQTGSSWSHTPTGGTGQQEATDVLSRMGGSGEATTALPNAAPNSFADNMGVALQRGLSEYFKKRAERGAI